ncbi:MAG: RDD family protein [Acidobacteria bacterium]|nr:RDD family protein [Acidobacteriota bacterium]
MEPEQNFPDLWVYCAACGQRNAEAEPRCEKCGRRLAARSTEEKRAVQLPAVPAVALPRLVSEPRQPGGIPSGANAKKDRFAADAPALPPQLRRHLSAKVQQFRARRSNPTLPFEPAIEETPENKVIPIRVEPQRRETRKTQPKPRRAPPVPEPQATLEFIAPAVPSEPVAVPPVAPFLSRMVATGVDLALLLAAGAVFLLFLQMVAGPVRMDRPLLAGCACGASLLALFYGATFLYGAGRTPGMKWLGLRLVNFDGNAVPRRQRLWRLGGVIVSAGSFFLGYLWGAFDEEGLFWHDHISKTFLTRAGSASAQ